jgi:hypothetical protein
MFSLGIASIAAYTVYNSNCALTDIKAKKHTLLSNIQTYSVLNPDLNNAPTKPFIMQLDNKFENGIFKVYEQKIIDTSTIVPYITPSLKVQYNPLNDALHPLFGIEHTHIVIQDRKIGFTNTPRHSFIVDKEFGTSNFVPMGNNILHNGKIQFDLDNTNANSEIEISDSANIEKKFVQKFNKNFPFPLHHNSVYRSTYNSLKDKPIYFYGEKINNKYFYSDLDTNPKKLVDKVYDGQQTVLECASVLGTAAFFGFGIHSLISLFSK